jgi:hypothetical protein
MSSVPPNSASRRPEGSWPPPEDEDFKIVPPPTTSQPVSSPVSAPPPAAGGWGAAGMGAAMPPPPPPQPPPPVTYTPPPRPNTVVAPKPGRTQAPSTGGGMNQRLILGIGAGAVLLAAIGFFFVFQMMNNGNTGNNGNNGNGTTGAVSLVAAATAVAANTDSQWETGLNGCAAIPATVPADQAKLASQTLVGCGMHLLSIRPADVVGAHKYFKKADGITPNDAAIKHQIELAERYINADATMRKPDIGGAIGQFEWFTKEPEFAAKPYADVPDRLYQAYIDSGNGYLQVPACDLAQHRFTQALAVKFVTDKSLANNRLGEAVKTCQKPATTTP